MAIFNPIAQLARCTRAHITAEVRFSADQTAEANKFLGTYPIGFDHLPPVNVDPAGALVVRAYTILPMIIVGKATARPTNDGWFHPAQGLDDISAKTSHVGDGRILADPDAVINAAAEVLGEMTVDIRVDG